MADVALTKKSETSTKITFTYAKAAGCEGYYYYVNGAMVSRVFDPDDLEVTFNKVSGATYRVVPVDVTERADGAVWPAPGPVVPVNTAAPTITGTPKVGQVLTCNPGTWTGSPTFTYQWWYERTDGTGDVRIDGYTQPTYTPVPDDVGGRDYCVVTATNAAGTAQATTAPTGAIQPADGPPPSPAWPPAGSYPELTLDFQTPPGATWHDEDQPPGTEIFRQAAHPLGGTTKVLKAYTGPNADSPATPQSSNADFYVFNGQAHAGQGQHTWYRGDLLLLEGHYQPTRGAWNWLMNWHISNGVSTGAGAASCTLGIHTDNTGTDANPTFWLQYQGGNPSNPLHADADLLPFTYGLHSFVFDYLWSTGPDGYCNVYYNGTFVRKFSGPNLYVRSDTGQPDIPAWGLYNYHIKVGRAMTTYWERCAAGPTKASVGL